MSVPVNDWSRDRVGIALLAPDIQKALLLGTGPSELDTGQLLGRELPLDWDAQREMLGFV